MIVTLTGPSGCGKTSLLFRLIKLWPDKIQPIISSTSRPPREREVEGENYYFVDREAFSREDMIEQVSFGGNLYGLTKQELDKAVNSNKICIAIVDKEGSLWLKEHYGAIRIIMKLAPGTSKFRLIRRDGEEAALKRHEIDKEAGLYDWDGYDISIQCRKKTMTMVTTMFVEGLKPFTKDKSLWLETPEGRHIWDYSSQEGHIPPPQPEPQPEPQLEPSPQSQEVPPPQPPPPQPYSLQ